MPEHIENVWYTDVRKPDKPLSEWSEYEIDELERWERWHLGVAVHKYLYEYSCEVNYVRQDLMTVVILADGRIKVAHAIDVAHFGYKERGL